MEKIKVKPIDGRIVIHPTSMKPIKQEGQVVYHDTQIRRYIKFGDLEIVEETKPKKKTTKKTIGD
jgi:hypothetical protein